MNDTELELRKQAGELVCLEMERAWGALRSDALRAGARALLEKAEVARDPIQSRPIPSEEQPLDITQAPVWTEEDGPEAVRARKFAEKELRYLNGTGR